MGLTSIVRPAHGLARGCVHVRGCVHIRGCVHSCLSILSEQDGVLVVTKEEDLHMNSDPTANSSRGVSPSSETPPPVAPPTIQVSAENAHGQVSG
jgi:hypothetical protein